MKKLVLLQGLDDVTAPDGIDVPRWVCEDPNGRTITFEITTVGLDLEKPVFQLHGVDADGAFMLQKKPLRVVVPDFHGQLQPCLTGLEAYVSSYVELQKNDAADSETIRAPVTASRLPAKVSARAPPSTTRGAQIFWWTPPDRAYLNTTRPIPIAKFPCGESTDQTLRNHSHKLG